MRSGATGVPHTLPPVEGIANLRIVGKPDPVPALSEDLAASPLRSSRLGPILLVASLAVQAALGAMILAKPPNLDRRGLSQWGAYALHPEREAPIFLSTVTAALLLLIVVNLASGRMASTGRRGARSFFASQWVQGAVAAAATLLFMAVVVQMRPYAVALKPFPGSHVAALALLAGVTLAFLAGAVSCPDSPRSGTGTRAKAEPARAPLPLQLSPWDLLVPLGIVILIYVPQWHLASGRLFLEENNIHWDLFAAGPGLMFRHGQALGTESHSFYGAGWPMLFAALSRWVPLTYGRMIQIGSVYLCIYLSGIYLLFRVLLRRPGRGVIGTVLVLLPFFYGLYGLYLWRAPNVTPMRWPLDVWCILALVMHARSSRRAWALIAGASVGLAIVFNINGGLELATGAGVYFLGGFLMNRNRHTRGDMLYALLAALLVAVAGIALAGRGRVLSWQFWAGWLKEPLVFSSLPLLYGTSLLGLFWFAGLVFFYLTVAGWAVSRAVGGRASMIDWLTGSIAVYGLMLLIKFVRYSSDQTLFRLLTPATILLMILVTIPWGRAVTSGVSRVWPKRLTAVCAAGLAAVLVIAGPGSHVFDPVLEYPNLLARQMRGPQPDGVCLMLEPKDLCGLPPEFEPVAARFQEITGRLVAIKNRGRNFAVVDENGSLFYLSAGTAPFGRYPRIFSTAITKERVQEITGFLSSNPPDYVLTRLPLMEGRPDFQQWSTFGAGPIEASFYGDLWESLDRTVQEGFSLVNTLDPYQLWRRKGLEP